jgi:hypothetical protein
MNLKAENIELQAKLMEGINKAISKVIISSAEKNEKLVIADKEGNVKHVDAKELLKTLPQTEK